MGWLHCVLLVTLAGSVPRVRSEVFEQEECFSPGQQVIHQQTDVKFCDRSGRKISIQKFCKTRLFRNFGPSSNTARLIFDSSHEDGSAALNEQTKSAHLFPPLCLPGTRSMANKGAWVCTCSKSEGGRFKYVFMCVVAEDQPGLYLGRSAGAFSSSRYKQFANSYSISDSEELRNLSGPGLHGRYKTTGTGDSRDSSTASSIEDELHGSHNVNSNLNMNLNGYGYPAANNNNNYTAQGTQGAANSPLRQHSSPVTYLDYCDEFAFLRTVSDCQWKDGKDPPPNKQSGSDSNYLYESAGEFDAYECLPGTYRARCEVCDGPPEVRACHSVPCPQS